MPRLVLLVVLSLTVLAVVPAVGAAAPPPRDQHIVVLKAGVDAGQTAREHRDRHGAALRHVYGRALNGYAARIPAGRLDALRSDRRVAYVERDAEVQASATTQTSATWGLDRVDQRALPLSGTYTYASTGSGVTAYVIDTGIRAGHQDFGGRVAGGYTAIADGRGTDDCNGHGTHVAGTVGGARYGVAKGVRLVPVRVLDCRGSGTVSGVIAGVDWVTRNAATPAVANMSLGGGASSSLDTSVRNSIAGGITYSLAAGNDGRDACNYSPARVPEGLTIGATGSSDAKPSWSNWGGCVDWFAPGASITSAYHTSNTATYTMSGTSMAAPHAAGAAVLYLQDQPTATPAAVASFLAAAVTKGIVTSSNTADNHLLFIDAGGSQTEDNAPAESSPFSLSAGGYKVKGLQHADLSWSGATSATVDVWRNGSRVVSATANDGAHTDAIGQKGGGTHTYRVCEAGTSTCSGEVVVSF
jgi:subtilisin family serine protease